LNTNCLSCPSGTYQPSLGAYNLSACLFCPRGTYNPYFNSSQCLSCLTGTTCPTGSKNYSANTTNFNASSDFRLIIFYLVSVKVVGKRTIATCDLFYAEKHKLGENGIRRKVSTSTGALFSSIALIIIVALIISSTVDFFYSNTITQQSLALNGTTSNNLIIKDTVSSLTIFQGSPFCSKTQITTQNINGNGNLSTSISNSTGNCKIVWTCPNSQFTGISQQICFNFNDPINIAFTSFISYNLNFTSVVDNSLFSLNGNLATNNIYYGTTPTTLDVSIYRSSLITLTGGNWAPVAHLGDYFASVPDNTKNGFYGLVL
jgi:hypothetical protein